MSNIKTTEIEALVQQVEKSLLTVGAKDITRHFLAKVCTGISFSLDNEKTSERISYKVGPAIELIANSIAALSVTNSREQLITSFNDALLPGWININRLIGLQCEILVKKEDDPFRFFLPYLFSSKCDKTLYELLSNKKFSDISLSISPGTD